jgi:hypothetical protein
MTAPMDLQRPSVARTEAHWFWWSLHERSTPDIVLGPEDAMCNRALGTVSRAAAHVFITVASAFGL